MSATLTQNSQILRASKMPSLQCQRESGLESKSEAFLANPTLDQVWCCSVLSKFEPVDVRREQRSTVSMTVSMTLCVHIYT